MPDSDRIEVPNAKVEVVCHGAGISLLIEGDTKHADQVPELIGNGVSFFACENTLKDKSIPKDKLLACVTTVPTGAVEIISKQREGYSYFKP
ncbi:MAG: DsrE family protein [Planctomycetaceae bacterium]